MARAAAPVIAVFVKNFLREIAVSASFENVISGSPHQYYVPHPAYPADIPME